MISILPPFLLNSQMGSLLRFKWQRLALSLLNARVSFATLVSRFSI